MSDEKIFNLTKEQIQKLSGTRPDLCDYNTPIKRGETLEPCIRGSRKFLENQEKQKMMYRVYRGGKNYESVGNDGE